MKQLEFVRPFLLTYLTLVTIFPEAKGQFHFPPYPVPGQTTCKDMNPYPDPNDCTKYFQCFRISQLTWLQKHLTCPKGGVWHKKFSACVEGTCKEVNDYDGTPAQAPKPKPKPSSPSKKPASKPKPKPKPTTKKPAAVPRPPAPARPPPAPSTGFYKCPSEGHHAHPTDPTKFHVCVKMRNRFYYYVHRCPPSTCFKSKERLCGFGACPSAG